MPSFDIHLAIARNYVKNHKEITNVQDFIKGSIAPDLVPDKRISHYTKEQDKNDLAKSLHNKVAIDEFLKRNEIKTDLSSIVSVIRQNTSLPCAIGFGISTPEQGRAMAAVSDGAIVGSAIIKLLEKYGKDAPAHIGKYVRTMKEALRTA